MQKTDSGYKASVEGLTMELEDWKDFLETLTVNPLRGYLRHYTLEAGDTVVDAGAYPGEFTAYAAKSVGPSGQVYAFEPNSDHADKIRRNCRLNSVENVTVIEKGLWNTDTKLSFAPQPHGASTIFTAKEETKIPVTTLDAFFSGKNCSIDLIKMDVEGAEIEALEGGRNLIENDSPAIAVASYHQRDGEKTAKKVEPILSSCGLKTETGYPQHLTTYGK